MDEHPQPVAELRRVAEVARPDLLPFVEGLPTRENPLGSLSDEFIEMNLLPPPQRPGGGGAGPRSRRAEATGSPQASRTPARPPRDIPHLLLPEKRKISHWNDRNELRGEQLDRGGTARRLDVGLISVPFSKTSILPNGAYAAPNALRDAWAIFTTFTPDYDVDMSSMRARVGDVSMPILDLVGGLENVQDWLEALMSQPEAFFPLIIGGDHAITAAGSRLLPRTPTSRWASSISMPITTCASWTTVRRTVRHPRHPRDRACRSAGRTLSSSGSTASRNASYYKRWVEARAGRSTRRGRSARRGSRR